MNKHERVVRKLIPHAKDGDVSSIVSGLRFANIDITDFKLVGEVVDAWYERKATATTADAIATDPMSGLAGGLYDSRHTDLGRCPACHGPMIGVTMAHNREGAYCPVHRVVIPDKVPVTAEVTASPPNVGWEAMLRPVLTEIQRIPGVRGAQTDDWSSRDVKIYIDLEGQRTKGVKKQGFRLKAKPVQVRSLVMKVFKKHGIKAQLDLPKQVIERSKFMGEASKHDLGYDNDYLEGSIELSSLG